MLGGPRFSTLETEIYIQTVQFLNLPMAGILSFLQLGFTMLVTLTLMRLGIGGLGLPVIPRVKSENLRPLRRTWEKIFAAGMIFLLLILLVSPVAALVFKSLLVESSSRGGQAGPARVLSLTYYRELFFNRRQSYFYVPPFQAILNSLRFALLSAAVSLLLGIMLAYGLNKSARWKSGLELLMMFLLEPRRSPWDWGFLLFRKEHRCQSLDGLDHTHGACLDLASICFTRNPASAALHTTEFPLGGGHTWRIAAEHHPADRLTHSLANVDDGRVVCFYDLLGNLARPAFSAGRTCPPCLSRSFAISACRAA